MATSLLGGPEASIVYCSTRRSTDVWANWLRRHGIRAASYHAGMSRADRDREQASWTAGTTNVMVATSAFGMGIDKADVRRVIHMGMPASLSAYYQEAGRAGRDGLPSDATLLYRDADVSLQRSMIDRSFADELDNQSGRRRIAARRGKAAAIGNLNDMLRYVRAEGCRRHALLTYFGEASAHRCGACDSCDEMRSSYSTPIRAESAARSFADRIREGELAWNRVPALPERDRNVLVGLRWSGFVREADDLDESIFGDDSSVNRSTIRS